MDVTEEKPGHRRRAWFRTLIAAGFMVLGVTALLHFRDGAASARAPERTPGPGAPPMHAVDLQLAQGDHAAIAVEGAYVQQTIGTSRTSGAYMTLHNRGRQDDRLIGVRTAVAGKAQIHRTWIGADGVATMRPVDAVEVPAGGTAELKSGGFHVMLMQLKHALKPGRDIPLTLVFEEAGEVSISVPVMAIGHGAPGHGAGDHGDMSDGATDPAASNGGK